MPSSGVRHLSLPLLSCLMLRVLRATLRGPAGLLSQAYPDKWCPSVGTWTLREGRLDKLGWTSGQRQPDQRPSLPADVSLAQPMALSRLAVPGIHARYLRVSAIVGPSSGQKRHKSRKLALHTDFSMLFKPLEHVLDDVPLILEHVVERI